MCLSSVSFFYSTVIKLSLEGCNYGEVVLVGNEISMASAVSKKCILKVKVDDVALCVVPANNRDDLEIQFKEQESSKKREDSLVQMTLSFPKGEDSGGATTAEIFHKSIMDSGLVSSVTGNIIAEFTKDQGNFVTPRGKYSMQVRAHSTILASLCTKPEQFLYIYR